METRVHEGKKAIKEKVVQKELPGKENDSTFKKKFSEADGEVEEGVDQCDLISDGPILSNFLLQS